MIDMILEACSLFMLKNIFYVVIVLQAGKVEMDEFLLLICLCEI
jgi:hypothetical protein